MNLNKAFILGRVTKDPEVRAMPSGQPVVNLGIATNRFYTDQAGQKKEETEFHNVVAFAKLADTISRYVTKGSLILIEGRIKTRNWNNSAGIKQYKTEIIADSLQLGPRPTGARLAPQDGAARPATTSSPNPTTSSQDIPIIEENQMPPAHFVSQEAAGPEDGEIDVKDIPF